MEKKTEGRRAGLARSHHAQCLYQSLVERLLDDGREHAAMLVETYWGRQGSAGLDARFLAEALVTRLHSDGAGTLADSLVSLLSQADVRPELADPVSLEEMMAHPNGEHRAYSLLRHRLELDGQAALAKKLTALMVSCPQYSLAAAAKPASTPPPPEPIDVDFHHFTKPDRAHSQSVAAAHDAGALVHALLARLHDDGRHADAGYVMLAWLQGVIGPIANPREVADALIEELRMPSPLPSHLVGLVYNDPNPDLADAIESLLYDEHIDRDPAEIRRALLDEVAGPIVTAGPLATALLESLRLPGHQEHPWLADAVMALLRSAEPPILDPMPRPPENAA